MFSNTVFKISFWKGCNMNKQHETAITILMRYANNKMYLSFSILLVYLTLCFSCTLHAGDENEKYAPKYGVWTSARIWGGGSLQNVLFCPSNSERLYTYVDVCGPFRSDDRGATWYSLEAAIPEMRCNPRGMVVDPRNADNIIVSAGMHWWKKGGIYVSNDGGKSFRKTVMTRFYGNGIRRRLGVIIDRDPFNPDVVCTASVQEGLWKTIDNGQNWYNTGLKNMYPCDLRYDRLVKGRIYLCAPRWGSGLYEKRASRKPKFDQIAGFFRSDDGGESWNKLSDESPLEIVQSNDTPERIYGIFDERVIRISSDGGETWQDCTKGLPIVEKLSMDTIQDSRFNVLAAGPDFILCSDVNGNIFRLDSGTDTWEKVISQTVQISDPDAGTLIETRFGKAMGSLVVDPMDANHWITADWYSLWETKDSGKTWDSLIKGISPLVMFTMERDPHNPEMLYLGMADNGVFISNDNGESFQLAANISVNSFATDPANKFIYCCGGKASNYIQISKDSGKTWTHVAGKGLPTLSPNNCAAYTVAVNPANANVYACVSGKIGDEKGGVYESSDQGENWQWIGKGLSEDERGFFDYNEFAGKEKQLVISPDGSIVCISRFTGDIYYWNAQSRSWKESNLKLTSNKDTSTGAPHIHCIVADPFRPGRFLCTNSSNHIPDGLFISNDGGKTFEKSWELTGILGSIAVDPQTEGRIFIHTAEGICMSEDGGTSWMLLKGYKDLPRKIYSDSLYCHGNRLFLITGGSGVFWMDLPQAKKN